MPYEVPVTEDVGVLLLEKRKPSEEDGEPEDNASRVLP